jgi:hypothetical protein
MTYVGKVGKLLFTVHINEYKQGSQMGPHCRFGLRHTVMPQNSVENRPFWEAIKKFPAFDVIQRLSSMFARIHHCTEPDESSPHPHTLILSSHLCLGLPSDLPFKAFNFNFAWISHLSLVVFGEEHSDQIYYLLCHISHGQTYITSLRVEG